MIEYIIIDNPNIRIGGFMEARIDPVPEVMNLVRYDEHYIINIGVNATIEDYVTAYNGLMDDLKVEFRAEVINS